MKSSMLVGGEKAGRQSRKEGKVESCHYMSEFFRVCILSMHLSSKLCGASAGGIRVFTAHPGNVNKQTGTGGERAAKVGPCASA